jgi:hypothetical protein
MTEIPCFYLAAELVTNVLLEPIKLLIEGSQTDAGG